MDIVIYIIIRIIHCKYYNCYDISYIHDYLIFSSLIYVLTSAELTATIRIVNIFGNEPVRGRKGDRGTSGPRGRPGQKGDAGSLEDSCMWIGNTVLKV